METNVALTTDSYKVTHWRQYPPRTTRVFSFFESRGGRFPEVVFFGLQYILKRYLAGSVITEEAIAEAKEVAAAHFGDETLFNEAGWRYIFERHGGRLPVEIRAVPEGTVVPVSNALMTIENTDPSVPWLTNYLETLLSQAWYPSTVATLSRAMHMKVLAALRETGDPSLADFKVHDFGFRGSTSVESAGIGGAAHLVNFKGTDTLAALLVARRYYGEPMAGFSIPAAEHSTITSWGRAGEINAYRNMLAAFPKGFVAVVSDSFNVYEACAKLWGDALRGEVLNRDGVLVVRPDSGDPAEVVPEVLSILATAFGYTINDKGYRVLNPHVRVIQGDGIDLDMLGKVLDRMAVSRWSADNIAFGSGGGLLQQVNRDTQKFAFKCSAVEVDGVWHDVMKDPVTDPGKRSKAGRLKLVRWGPRWNTLPLDANQFENLLVPVFRDGEILADYSFEDIRRRVREWG